MILQVKKNCTSVNQSINQSIS